MAETWQDVLQRLILANPRHFVSWVMPEVKYLRTLESTLPSIYRMEDIEAGPLLLGTLDGEEVIVHFEFQGRDTSMDTYALVRHTAAGLVYQLPVYTHIIYARDIPPIVTPPFEEWGMGELCILSFNYNVVKLWEYSAADLLQRELSGLLPLLPLTHDGAQREVFDTMIARIIQAHQCDLLSASEVFADLAFSNEVDRHWLDKKLKAYCALVD